MKSSVLSTTSLKTSPKQVISSLLSAIIISMIDIPFEISLAVLVFSGMLTPYLAYGVGIFLIGVMLISWCVSLTSSFRGSIGVPQENTAVLIAVMAGGIVAAMGSNQNPDAVFYTVVVAMMITTLLTGVSFLILGLFHMGNLTRFIPYPVIGGFIAGTGWLLVKGGLGVLTHDSALNFRMSILSGPVLGSVVFGLIFSLSLLITQRKSRQPLLLPAIILFGSLIYFLVLRLFGLSLSDARQLGLLLGNITDSGLWKSINLDTVVLVNWAAIFGQAGQILIAILISIITLLLNASALELAVNQEIDLNRELRSSSIANLVSGLFGSPPGFNAFSFSALSNRLHANNRMTGFFFGMLAGIVLLFGAPLLNLIPRAVVGGLLTYLGMLFLVEWLYDAWFKLSHADYAVVMVIMIVVGIFGPLIGVALGIILAASMFVYEYSRTNIIRHSLSGKTYRSQVERSPLDRKWLEEHGDEIHMVELQGFVFFGTAHRLYEGLKARITKPAEHPLRFIIVDFRQVTGLDASAVISFAKLEQVAIEREIRLVFTHVSQDIQKKLRRGLVNEEGSDIWYLMRDLDHGMEWCENRLISQIKSHLPTDTSGIRIQSDRQAAFHGFLLTHLANYLEEIKVETGYRLIKQGANPVGLLFVDSGKVTAQLETEDGKVIRLQTMEAGTIVGELGVYLHTPASAAVVTEQPSTIYLLRIDRIKEIEENNPVVAMELHKFIAQRVSERLLTSLGTIRELLS